MEYTIELTTEPDLVGQGEAGDLVDELIGKLETHEGIFELAGFGLGDGGIGVVFNLEAEDVVAAAAQGVALVRSALEALDLPGIRRLEVRPPETD